jgi:hypothetical protein
MIITYWNLIVFMKFIIFLSDEGGNTFHINPQLLPPPAPPLHAQRGRAGVRGGSICMLKCVSYRGIWSREETGEERNVVRLFRDPTAEM